MKSCAGFEVNEWKADGMGLQYDREWALVDSKGMYVNQKKIPKLCLVRPVIDIEYLIAIIWCPKLYMTAIEMDIYT